MKVIRGATTCDNTEQSISCNAVQLIKEIMQKNGLLSNTMSVVIFSATQDLDAQYPAKAVREQLNLNDVPMMCFEEMKVKGSLPRCLRVAVFTNLPDDTPVKHCYINGAESLRPDLI